MNTQKQRVIAIDYFRGICILMVVINHAALFSWPLPLIDGDGRLWTSAAEMFFLLSGITLWIVRGQNIISDFKNTAMKIWRRSASIYYVYLICVLASLYIALLFNSHNIPVNMAGQLPTTSPVNLLLRILGFSYTIGWADFLMYYTVYLLITPGVMRLLHSRWWLTVPAVSLLAYSANSLGFVASSPYTNFLVWQAYFFLGLCIGRLRPVIIPWLHRLSPKVSRLVKFSVVGLAGAVLSARLLWSPHAQNSVQSAVGKGWLPHDFGRAYGSIINHKATADFLLQNSRAGLLRPAVAVLTLAAAYLVYQKYKDPILKYTGSLVNNFGRNTLWVFAGQAIAIPLLSALPLSHKDIYDKSILVAILMLSMWLVARRQATQASLRLYMAELKNSYRRAKYNYIQSYEDTGV